MKTEFFQAISGKVDRDAGLIRGVSVITEGEALGHPFKVDRTTLEQVKQCADTHAGGVRVKVDHGTGFDAIVGNLRNFFIDGNQLRADLHMVKSHESYPVIMELAETQPETFGLSISFTGKHEVIDGVKFARCTELYSVDLVDMPAANPSGLFSAVDSPAKVMIDFKSFFSELRSFNREEADKALAAVQSEVSNLKTQLSQKDSDLATALKTVDELKSAFEKLKADHAAELKAKDEQVETLASAKAAAITAAQGQPPLENKPKENATKTEADKPKLFGFARVQAAIREQLQNQK
jgi:hypothetical protein